LDEVKRLGLTLDQYLASTGRNVEGLRGEYRIKAENDVKLEFILQKIAETEKIKVEEKEIDEAIAQTKTDTERQNLSQNRYLLANIIRQQKTLDFLRSL
jgi:trigger factor